MTTAPQSPLGVPAPVDAGSGVVLGGAPERPLTRRDALRREREGRASSAPAVPFGAVVGAPEAVTPAALASAPAAAAVTAAADVPAPPLLRRRDLRGMQPIVTSPGAPAPAAASPVIITSATLPPAVPTPAAFRRTDASASNGRGRSSARSVRDPAVRPRAMRPSAVRSRAARPSGHRGIRPSTRFGVIGAMLFVGATIVSTSVPANAYFVDTPSASAVKLAVAARSGTTTSGTLDPASAQRYVAPGGVAVTAVGRDGYSVTSPSIISSAGTFTNDPLSAIQWPFPTGVPISSGFGSRKVANCSFCSTFHQGLDFTPGAGTPIQIVADGTVSKVEQGGGALGYNVWIDHVIDGQKVTTVYAHMTAGSIRVTKGEQVTVGQIVGLVGSTGNSTGAHLHFEVHLDGVSVDPYPWLVAHAGAA
ncbi:M23 family metallopeptidase [Frondihabitans cladoniiphilus]|uniref:M23ase beta-sheet core domain-containing protein n=1 Tax=Frondihabitans cladoniiphilus TaxID=715785 RepID=A0ABP8W2I7_9MICO